MTLLENPTTSKRSSKAPIISWFIALLIICGVAIYILNELKEDPERKSPAQTSSIPEPENILAQESRVIHNSPSSDHKIYYVSPGGNDTNSGTIADQPLKTIQKAIDQAEPGDTVSLAEGTYLQDVGSKRNGTPEARIILKGTPEAIVKGTGKSRIIEIQHDYITVEGFTIDGLVGDSEKQNGYRDKLIYVQGKEERKGVTGLRVLHMNLKNAGGECIRLRYFAEKNEIAHNTITGCGAYDFKLDGDGKNGEGIYIGTAPEQQKDGNNPTTDVDTSRYNWIHHNTFDTQGNECVDIKEGSEKNIVEYNSCTGQEDKESGGMDSRGNENIFRFNKIFGNRGAGIRLGGDKKDQGINNFLYENTISDNEEGGIKIMREPQAKICGNIFSGNEGGKLVGDYGEDFENPKNCP